MGWDYLVVTTMVAVAVPHLIVEVVEVEALDLHMEHHQYQRFRLIKDKIYLLLFSLLMFCL